MTKPSERVVPRINAALERNGLPYRVVSADDVERARTGHWQRSEGACRWWATARHIESPESSMTIMSWDTMTECARRDDLEIRRGVVDWEVGVPGGN